jgi:hypothetical protein
MPGTSVGADQVLLAGIALDFEDPLGSDDGADVGTTDPAGEIDGPGVGIAVGEPAAT